MAGQPGRSGGHNRLTPEAHILRGTFNPTRHAPLLPQGPPWHPDEGQLAALGDAGRAFVSRIQAVYTLGALDGELALEGAHAVDRLADVRTRRATVRAVKVRLALDRLELAWQTALTRCVLALRARLVPPNARAAKPATKWAELV